MILEQLHATRWLALVVLGFTAAAVMAVVLHDWWTKGDR